jgi:hypothetical protein
MRSILALAGLAAVLVAVPAQAEKRLFIIASDTGGYGVDRCLASGAACGAAVASAYCQSRDFTAAVSFRKVDREDITGAIPTNASASTCKGSGCEEYVAIECSR